MFFTCLVLVVGNINLLLIAVLNKIQYGFGLLCYFKEQHTRQPPYMTTATVTRTTGACSAPHHHDDPTKNTKKQQEEEQGGRTTSRRQLERQRTIAVLVKSSGSSVTLQQSVGRREITLHFINNTLTI